MDTMLSKETEQHLEILCKSLTDVTVKRRLDSKTILIGVQAFLMAMVASGNADQISVSNQLAEMAEYFVQPDCAADEPTEETIIH